MTIQDRFKGKYVVSTTSGCWLWSASTDKRGRGYIWNGHKMEFASRVSYKLFVGVIPENLFVCHSCDSPRCVNPAHLFVGTQADNIKDMVSKDRTNNKGETNGNAKLSIVDVQKIRKQYLEEDCSMASLAQSFNVSKGQIQKIVRNRSWA